MEGFISDFVTLNWGLHMNFQASITHLALISEISLFLKADYSQLTSVLHCLLFLNDDMFGFFLSTCAIVSIKIIID